MHMCLLCLHLLQHWVSSTEPRMQIRSTEGGGKFVTMMIREEAKRDLRCSMCDVAKASALVPQMCRAGNCVVVNQPWREECDFIRQLGTGEMHGLHEVNGLYMLNVRVTPTSKQMSNYANQGFTWLVSP